MKVIVYDLPTAAGQEFRVADRRLSILTKVKMMSEAAALALIAAEVLPPNSSNINFVDDTDLPTLWQAQNRQAATLRVACAGSIVAGWVSSALGSPHLYPAKPTDQANMMASCIDAQRVPPAWQAATASSAFMPPGLARSSLRLFRQAGR